MSVLLHVKAARKVGQYKRACGRQIGTAPLDSRSSKDRAPVPSQPPTRTENTTQLRALWRPPEQHTAQPKQWQRMIIARHGGDALLFRFIVKVSVSGELASERTPAAECNSAPGFELHLGKNQAAQTVLWRWRFRPSFHVGPGYLERFLPIWA